MVVGLFIHHVFVWVSGVFDQGTGTGGGVAVLLKRRRVLVVGLAIHRIFFIDFQACLIRGQDGTGCRYTVQ